jgi:nucleotide-binding universal stress UspA family protein
MTDPSSLSISYAIEDFHRARRRAALEEILAKLTGKSTDLLSFEDMRQKLKTKVGPARELKEIPLDAIVGSADRYTDFTRSFLPRQDFDRDRWARVMAAVTNLTGLPPIEVYQIGEVYFVLDGHHRVSVARQLGATHIQAYVTKLHPRVPLSPEDQLDDLVVKTEYADFLERTHLDELRPDADLRVTAAGKYRLLEEHIEVHRYFMGLEQKREIPYTEAVGHWYDEVYLPVAQAIRERGILRDFPGRTETDLYLWVSEHRAALEEKLGWTIEVGEAAADLATQFSPTPPRIIARLKEKVLDALIPDELEAGPPPGQWRREQLTARQAGRLAVDILVPISGEEVGWHALDQALVVARREGARLRGLHVVSSTGETRGERVQALRAEFERRCQAAGIPGELAIDVGGVARKICERARWADLTVLKLTYPPAPQPLARLSSGFRTLIQRCPTPLLAVPETSFPLERLLLAYDGSLKASEALFLATYVAGQWGLPLVVVTVAEKGRVTPDTLAQARRYLETHEVQATFVHERGSVARAILKAANEHASDLLIMGGYGFRPVLQLVLGSTVDEVLRESEKPILICQ